MGDDATLVLTKVKGGRHVLEGVGTISREGGLLSRRVVLEAGDGRRWTASRKGLRQQPVFLDVAGAEAARWSGDGAFRRGGRFLLGDVEAARLAPASIVRHRFVLSVDGTERATIGVGLRTKVELAAGPAPDAMLLLAAVWLVRELADDSSAAA